MFCEKNEFLCQGQDNLCIPTPWVCDGVADCFGAEDEDDNTCGNYYYNQCTIYQMSDI